ncbi:hypothetical protein [Staphylococcus intermedius]|uniref:Uncharacterized protein n=1 Tax=Staphylococcus intermedius NCTC 11048 TaxID=1141106 RepID=A0A380GAB8_STAIN|nr:hypothetical protein [Staphylococcus intermedius]PCF80899.1 hypothetical protein B4W74_04360 [Staphylococcus intermedius]PCF88584.1 hypothetical protein B4W75_07390 [Staphylococcus intermedius]PNZ47756.1 hypothetical protein CD138_13860 [Staphylococcus intermedius NCTC 11048]SUM47233.1 Uncharacterised protein [Staphylococcus intermedius NCTC 11048]
MYKKISLFTMIFSIIFVSIIPNFAVAETNNKNSNKLDITSVNNLEEILKNKNLSKKDILQESYKMSDGTGIINLKDSKNDIYYNFYVENKKITYFSTQSKLSNGNALFKLFDINDNFLYSSEANQNGEIIKEQTAMDRDQTAFRSNLSGTQKAALKWACIFSSKVSCATAAAGVAAGGTLMGPWGAVITGGTAASACELLFTTLVEKYGGKDAACSL